MIRSLLAVLILESLLAPRLGAQSETTPIVVDIVVRDKKNVPAADLRAEEVEIYEGGIKQTFEGFRRVGIAPAGPAGAPASAAPEDSRLVALLFPRLPPAERDIARDAADEFLKKQLAPGISVAVLLVGPELLPIQGFTQDAAVLKDAVRRALVPNPKAGDPDVQALYSLVQWLKGQPGRKAAILFSSGLGVPPGFEESAQDVQGLANRYRISFYGVDPRGVEMAKTGIRSANQESEGLSSELWGMGGQSRIGEDLRGYGRSFAPSFPGSSPEALAKLAQGTGGFVLERSNSFSKGMRQIGEDITGYYEFTYVPTVAKAAGENRTLEVKVAREGARVQARQHYLVGEVAAALVPAFEKRLAEALVVDRPADSVEVWSRALHYAWDGQEQTQVLWLSLPLAKVALPETTPPGRFEGAVSILSRVKDASGKVVATHSQRIPLVGPVDQLGRARGQSLPFVRRVKLGPGDYIVETAVQDERADKLTVRRTPLKVQAPQGLAMSSLSLGELLPASAGGDPDDPLRIGNQRLIPNLGQPIKAGQAAMTLYSVVYPPSGSKEPANMTITLSLDNQAVNRATAVLPAPDASGRIPYATALKMDVLPAGSYRFDVAVAQGAGRAEESLTFTITP